MRLLDKCSGIIDCLDLPAVTRGLKIAGILVVAVLLTALLRRAVHRVEERLARESGELRAAQRTRTLTKVLTSAGIVTIWVLAFLTILGTLEFDLAPLLAGLGIGGLAIGFGAQSLVKDVVSGFFILLEDQYGIGDLVQINAAPTGRVEQLTLRVTGLRDLDGTLHYISNGTITQVSNRSKDWSGTMVDVRIPASSDLDEARRILDDVAAGAKTDSRFGSDLLGPPKILGIESVSTDDVVLRMMVETRPGRQLDVARAMRARIKEAFDAANMDVSTV